MTRRSYGSSTGGTGAMVTVEDLSDDVLRLVRDRTEDAVQALTIDATNRMLDLVTAETVTRGATGEFKRRSRPGEPPRQDTGRLADSIAEARQVRRRGDLVVGIVGSTVRYARFLELGTRFLRPRPFLRPAVAETAKQADRIIRQVLQRGRA